MSCSGNGPRLVTTALAVALLLSAASLAAQGSPPPGFFGPDRASADLDRAETILDEIERRLDGLRCTAPEVPPDVGERLDWVEGLVRSSELRLRGVHYTQARPLLDRRRALLERIRALHDELEAWDPAQCGPAPAPDSAQGNGTASISGTVTDEADGHPLAFVRVHLRCDYPYVNTETLTGTTGAYTFEGLEANTCYVWTENQLGYFDEVWNDHQCDRWGCSYHWLDGDPIVISEGEDVTDIDFALERGGEVRGRVTDGTTGARLADVWITVYDSTGRYVMGGYTDTDGGYRAGLLHEGTYFVWAYHGSYAAELYDDIPCGPDCPDPTVGTPVAVARGQIVDGTDFALTPLPTVSGTVTELPDGTPAYTWVEFYDENGNFVDDVWTSHRTGAYTLSVYPGTYYLIAEGTYGHASEIWQEISCAGTCDPTTGTPVTVQFGTDATGIDFTLDPLPSISGTVTEEGTGVPLESCTVRFYEVSGAYRGGATTNRDGGYTSRGLRPGTYFATAGGCSHAMELYQEIPCRPWSCDPSSGTPIAVDLGADATGVDFTLGRTGKIRGTVTAAVSGAPLEEATVNIYDDTGHFAGYALTDADGAFDSPDLPPGTYYALADDRYRWWEKSRFQPQLYDGIDCSAGCDPVTGTPISVVADATAVASFSVHLYGHIVGTVTNQFGDPVTWSRVEIFTENLADVDILWGGGSGGFVSDPLPPGNYYVLVRAEDHVDELYDGIPCEGGSCDISTGTPVTVTLDSETPIAFVLHRQPAISGVVTDAFRQRGVNSGCIWVFDSSGAKVAGTCLHSHGRYHVLLQDPGTYFVATGISSYLDQLYQGLPCEGGCDVTQGTPVAVGDGEDVTGVDFVLEPVPLFDDVPAGHWARKWIEELYWHGVTAGCATDPLRYCPADHVLRKQMAVFLLRSKEGSYYTPPPAVGVFTDVPPEDPFAPWIEELAARGVTSGCGEGKFCPDAPVTRAQMAAFLLVTLEGALYTPPPAVGMFADVSRNDPFAPWIEELARRGITAGCGGGNYCPDDPVTRAEMAVLLVTTFSLPF